MSVIRGIEAFDNAVLHLGATAKDFGAAVHHQDPVGTIQASAEHIEGYANGARYVLMAKDKGSMLASFIFSVDGKTISWIDKVVPAQVLGVLGIVLGTLTVIIQSVSIYRLNQVLSIIPEKGKIQNASDLSAVVQKLKEVKPTWFTKIAPEHLRAKVETTPQREQFFEELQEDIKTNEGKKTKEVLTQIHNHAVRKRVVHILALIGGIVSIVASIGLLVGFPPLALTLLAVVGVVLTISCLLLDKGWAHNPYDGFDWKLCIPEAIRKKAFKEDGRSEEELTAVASHDGIVLQPHFVPPRPDVPEEDQRLKAKNLLSNQETKNPVSSWNRFTSFFRKEVKPETNISLDDLT